MTTPDPLYDVPLSQRIDAQCVTYPDGSTGPCDAHDPRRGRQPGLYVVFDGPPSHESGRFVEVEDETGAGVGVGEWRREGDLWSLGPFAVQAVPALDVPAFPLDIETFLAGLDSPNHSEQSRRDWCRLFFRDMQRAVVARSAPSAHRCAQRGKP